MAQQAGHTEGAEGGKKRRGGGRTAAFVVALLLSSLAFAAYHHVGPGGEPFERVHRKALLNLDRVDRLEPEETGGFTAYTKDGVQIPVSRQSARKLRRLWNLPR